MSVKISLLLVSSGLLLAATGYTPSFPHSRVGTRDTYAGNRFTEPDLPDVAFVNGLVGNAQTYSLSCESRSAADVANFWGVPVDEVEFFNSLPVSDNPDKGFVGSVRGVWGHTPPDSYGVHAGPVADLLRVYGLDAQARYWMTLDELKREIANGRPVVVWVVGHVWPGTYQTYIAQDGSRVTVAPFEHTMIAYGYDKGGIYLIDAGSGTRRNYGFEKFSESWEVLGNMAVTMTGPIQQPQSETIDWIYDAMLSECARAVGEQGEINYGLLIHANLHCPK